MRAHARVCARNTDIGAVGAGASHPDDKFGTFGK